MASLRVRPQSDGDELIEMLLDSADFTKFTPEERVKYQKDMTTERDIRNQMAYRERVGREERSMEIAKNLLAKGFPIDDIADATGIGAEELKKMQ